MDLTNFWFSSGSAGGGDDPGEPIGESLRLRGQTDCWLTRTFSNNGNQQVFTLSGWMKPSLNPIAVNQGGPMINLLGTGSGGASQDNYAFFSTSAAFFSNTAANTTLFSGNVGRALRDPSAWYHVVVSVNTPAANDIDRFRVWINGELQTFNTGQILPAQNANSPTNSGNRQHYIGCFNDPGGTIPSTGYIADYYFLDGTVADETNFGRFNTDNVWVPDPDEFTAAQYGANGYHLTFANPDDIGEDTAPIGAAGHTAANNWTVGNGFDTAPVGIFSNELVSSTGSFGANAGPTKAFDGSTTTFAQTSAIGGTMTFTPSTPINYQSLHYFNVGATWDLNNGTTGGTTGAAGWQQIDGNPGTLTSLQFLNDAGGAAAVGAIAINGTAAANELVDNTGVDYDSMQDSPTQNWATLNPLPPRSSGVIQNANLEADIGSLNQYIWGTQAMTSPCYWETQFVSGDPFEVGLVDIRATTRDSFLGGTGGNTYGYGTNGQITNNAASGATTYTTWGVNDVISQAYDPETGRWWAAVNGVWVGGGDPAAGTDALHLPPNTGTNDQLPEAQRAFMTPGFGPNGGTSAINFGQQPFLFPVPDGFNRLQTQNLPAAPIADGRDYFQAITAGPDQGVGAGELGGNWSTYLSAPVGSVASASNAFDGSTDTAAFNATTGQPLIFAPDTPIQIDSSFEVWVSSGGMSVDFNDINVPTSNLSWVEVATSGVISASNPVTFNVISANCNVNALRVDGDILVDAGPLAAAQAAFDTGLWWIKDMVNANEHQLVDSVRGGNLALQCPNNAPETAYDPPDGDSVAWCWNYNSADPTVNGFEIIDPFQVTALQMTVPHNLGAAPEFIISKFIDSAVVWRTWHKDLNAGNTLFLSKSDAQTASACRVDNVTSTDFEWNSLQSSVDDNQNVINYAWTSVPGYSAFGSYTGNNNADGPFIYTGMRSAFVMIKRTDTNGDWYVWDTTRDINNPCFQHLIPDSTNPENTNSGTANQIDILSNGFKLLSTGGNTNAAGTYVYACFAENPFGGSNVSPVTAR